ncbi:hypothetical protein BDV93DRAFT_557469 [Ceratobasidium sp. AG-I]|nr:hypothetical protein BDV93DRAFT_557469 [Ceratobasidium sp. AG-I]
MPDWITVSGVITNVATAFDLSYRYAPHEMIVGKDAGTLLKEAKQILRDAVVVLEDHKDVLSPDEYERFKLQYRSYNWQITDESQEHRAVKDALVKQSRILSQLYANKDSHQKRAHVLLRNVENYQTNVLAASRSATSTEPQFPDDDVQSPWSSSEKASNQSQGSPASFTSWFSVFGKTSSAPPPDLESGVSPSPSSTPPPDAPRIITEGQGFIVAITHIPETESSSVDIGSGELSATKGNEIMYRQMISFESAGRRVDIIDPKLHSADPRNTVISEKSIHAMKKLGERLLSEQDLRVPEGSKTTSNAPDTPSMENTIQRFQQLSANP